MVDTNILQILGDVKGHQEHFRRDVFVCHKLFENDHRILQEFSFGVWQKEPSGHFIWLEEEGLVFENSPFKVFIESLVDFVAISVFSDAH